MYEVFKTVFNVFSNDNVNVTVSVYRAKGTSKKTLGMASG